MWAPAIGGPVALVLAAQVAQTRGCRADPPAPAPNPVPSPSASPSPSPPPAPVGEVFTTQDGIRFRVETVVQSLEIPWAMAFAPDGRLFVTERPGRVRILNLASSTSDLALTIADVFAQDEAGLLGLRSIPSSSRTAGYTCVTPRRSPPAAG
jgi:glucose/arabinose dehydrogenase